MHITSTVLKKELKNLIKESQYFLQDVKHYHIPSSANVATYISQKLRQLEGMALTLEENSNGMDDADLWDLYQVYREIHSGMHYEAQKWKRLLKLHYKKNPKSGKIFFVSSV